MKAGYSNLQQSQEAYLGLIILHLSIKKYFR